MSEWCHVDHKVAMGWYEYAIPSLRPYLNPFPALNYKKYNYLVSLIIKLSKNEFLIKLIKYISHVFIWGTWERQTP